MAHLNRILVWVSPAFSLAGLVLSVWGVMLLAFGGVLGAKVNYSRLYIAFLFGNRVTGQPALDREPPIAPWLTGQETKGWRLMAWGFTLQGWGETVLAENIDVGTIDGLRWQND